MKSKGFILLSALLCVSSGCTIEEVQTWGDSCPPRVNAVEGATLSYIGDPVCTAETQDKCDVSSLANKKIDLYFKTHNCPPEFKNCVQDEGELSFHCEKEKETVVVTECAQGILCKDENGENFCLDPSVSRTCGATDCDNKGQNCQEFNSTCEEHAPGEYVCISRETQKIVCSDAEADPSSKLTCGASHCREEDNYGGQNCADLGPESFCGFNAKTEAYSCRCPDSFILCDGKCVNPGSSKEFCGAKGECSSDDPTDENYRGYQCASTVDDSAGYCSEGRCRCSNPKDVWCIIDELNDGLPQCYSPSVNETCNVRLSEDGIHCDINPCEEHFACEDVSVDSYECVRKSCVEGEQFCAIGEERACFPMTDFNHCGSCGNNCEINSYNNVEPYDCLKVDETNYACAYHCTDGMENCGSETEPQCFDLSTTSKHCGSCDNACDTNGYCEGGKCYETECKDFECTTRDENNHKTCVNEDKKCGKDCAICTSLHDNGYCLNGFCFIRECLAGEHPIFNESGQITACEKNSNERCAPVNMKQNDPVYNCSEILTGHVVGTMCAAEGICKITKCEKDYHLSADAQSCIANSKSSCAPANKSETTDCTKIEHSSKTECVFGECSVVSCAAEFHLNAKNTGCVANSDTACTAVDSHDTRNCTTIPSIASASAGTCSAAGSCTVSSCAKGFHLNRGKDGCDVNMDVACAKVNSNSEQNCQAIANIASASAGTCAADGTCTVSSCAPGFHLNSDKTGCVANSNTACGKVNSTSTQNCQTIVNIASASAGTCTSSGTCTVSSCAAGFHLNSGKTGCVQNTDALCAPVNSSSTQDCKATNAEMFCLKNGTCGCSEDGSLVANFNNTTCIRKECEGFVGATADTCGKRRCIPTSCAPGFKHDGSCDGGWSTCRPKCNSKSDCLAIQGWKTGTCNSGTCGSPLTCSNTNYHNTCQPRDFSVVKY